MKNKVLFLVNHDVVIYNFRKEIVLALIDRGYEVHISSPYGKRIDNLIEMGCKYHEIDINRHGTNPFEELKLLKNYFRLFKRVKPDIVLTFTIKPNIYGGIAARSMKIPYVANITGLGTAVENKGLLQKVTLLLYKFSFKDVQTIFMQNKENFDFFVKNKIKEDRLKLIPGSGVNIEEFKVQEYPKSNNIKFLYISRIMKEKGIDQYLDAAEYITKKYPNTEFHILGFCEEKYEKKLEEMGKKGVITYHGMQENVKRFIKTSHCTIHPTYYPEGMSNVLLESASSGRPIITTNRSGCREVVDNGINGYIVNPKNSDDLIKKIIRFLELSYKEKRIMGIRGRKKIEKSFNREIVVRAYLQEIGEV